MKKMWSVGVVSVLMLLFTCIMATSAIAMDQCEVVGNSYTMVYGDECVLSNFVNTVGFSPMPPCGGTVDFTYSGEIVKFLWNVNYDKTLTIAGLPAVLSTDGLKIYGIPTELYSLQVGNKIYKTEQKIQSFLFK